MIAYVLAAAVGIVAGLRTFTAPAAVSWAAASGWLDLQDSWLAFLGYTWTPYVLTVLALFELGGDKLPTAPSRTIPMGLAGRLASGAISGAAIGVAGGIWIAGFLIGALGALAGTFGGYALRMRLAKTFGRDLPAALVEDAIAVGGAIVIVALL